MLVIPCHNETSRIDDAGFRELGDTPGLRLLFVDDASTDGTGERLEALGVGAVRRLPQRRGKAEAVRAGLLEGLATATVVGYADADLSTPPAEILRLRAEMARYEVVLASRVAMMGRRIDRNRIRHWLGRVFATFASSALDAPFYDTQCGAKLFRVTPLLGAVLEEPFRSGWAFDVELLARLLGGTRQHAGLPHEAFVEVPLFEWRDVRGTKRTAASAAAAFASLPAIALDLRRRRTHRPPNGG
jgi:glycosyltransferase involved in cell wall biosynthesis